MSGTKFIKKWQVRDKIIEWIVFPIHIQPFTIDSNSRNNQSQGFKNSQIWYEGLCMSGGMFLKEWQVRDKIIEWNCFPIHIQHFVNNSNSKNN